MDEVGEVTSGAFCERRAEIAQIPVIILARTSMTTALVKVLQLHLNKSVKIPISEHWSL